MTKNNLTKIHSFMTLAEKLKDVERYNANKLMPDRESTADHSWKLATMVLVIAKELDLKIDTDHAIRIALFHDIIEAIAGDVDFRDIHAGKITVEEKKRRESQAVEEIKAQFNDEVGDEVYALWLEYEKGETPEAKFIKALDKIECIDHLVYQGHTYYDVVELIPAYADKAVSNFPELKPLLRSVKKKLKAEYEKGGVEWKKEYDKAHKQVSA